MFLHVEDPTVISWDEFLKLGTPEEEAEVERRVAAAQLSDLSTLIYTSGYVAHTYAQHHHNTTLTHTHHTRTTGPPKAVMLSHKNVLWTVQAVSQVVPFVQGDRLVSFLPLAHVAEQVVTIYLPLLQDGSVYFSEGMEKLAENIREVEPTVFFAPPRYVTSLCLP